MHDTFIWGPKTYAHCIPPESQSLRDKNEHQMILYKINPPKILLVENKNKKKLGKKQTITF